MVGSLGLLHFYGTKRKTRHVPKFRLEACCKACTWEGKRVGILEQVNWNFYTQTNDQTDKHRVQKRNAGYKAKTNLSRITSSLSNFFTNSLLILTVKEFKLTLHYELTRPTSATAVSMCISISIVSMELYVLITHGYIATSTDCTIWSVVNV